jgi:arsenate reductase (thioredoxin)
VLEFAVRAPRTPHDQPHPNVHVVCIHNAGRFQKAAALLNQLANGRIEVRSAGTEPADHINPVAITAVAELGIDITAATPTVVTSHAVQTNDVVITMGCGDICPNFPGVSNRDWKTRRPRQPTLKVVKQIRDDIARESKRPSPNCYPPHPKSQRTVKHRPTDKTRCVLT